MPTSGQVHRELKKNISKKKDRKKKNCNQNIFIAVIVLGNKGTSGIYRIILSLSSCCLVQEHRNLPALTEDANSI